MTWNSSQFTQVFNKVNFPHPEENKKLSLEEFLEEDFKLRGELYELLANNKEIPSQYRVKDKEFFQTKIEDILKVFDSYEKQVYTELFHTSFVYKNYVARILFKNSGCYGELLFSPVPFNINETDGVWQLFPTKHITWEGNSLNEVKTSFIKIVDELELKQKQLIKERLND